jgi:hypothetical protein
MKKPKTIANDAFYGWDIAKANHGLAAAVIGVAAIVVIWLSFSWLVANPIEEAHDELLVPAGQALGVMASQCPDGWHGESLDLEGAVTLATCSRAIDGIEYVVTLRAGKCESVIVIGGEPVECEDVPQWPSS